MYHLLWCSSPVTRVPQQGEGKVNNQRKHSHLRPDPQGFCYSNMGSDSTLDRVVMATEHRRSPASLKVLAVAPLSAVLLSIKVIGAAYHEEKCE